LIHFLTYISRPSDASHHMHSNANRTKWRNSIECLYFHCVVDVYFLDLACLAQILVGVDDIVTLLKASATRTLYVRTVVFPTCLCERLLLLSLCIDLLPSVWIGWTPSKNVIRTHECIVTDFWIAAFDIWKIKRVRRELSRLVISRRGERSGNCGWVRE
jgi:hypothetical protein